MSAPEETLIDRFLTVFGEPKVDAPEAYVAEFAKALRGWEAHVLDRAGDEVIRTCKFWPRPAEVIDIARGISAEIAAGKRRSAKSLAEADRPPPSQEQADRAAALVAGLKQSMAAEALPRRDRPIDWTKAQRPGFERMQGDSRNRGLHGTLTVRSKAMAGDRDA